MTYNNISASRLGGFSHINQYLSLWMHLSWERMQVSIGLIVGHIQGLTEV